MKQQEAGKHESEPQAAQTTAAVDGAAAPAETATEPKPRKKAERADGTMSGLDAAAMVLTDAGQPLNCKTIVQRAIEQGYWKTDGKTPSATVYSAILREIQNKGDASRFAKADRGMFKIKAWHRSIPPCLPKPGRRQAQRPPRPGPGFGRSGRRLPNPK